MKDIIDKARSFAEKAHEGQKRKYTGDAYVIHPIAVAELVQTVTDDQEVIAAALLHDVVEDTDYTIDDIKDCFGIRVAGLVSDLTDVSVLSDGNRKVRKEIDRQHTAEASAEAKTVKLADLINNSESILEHGGDFTKVYMNEKRLLLEVLKEGDKRLYKQAAGIVSDYFG